MFGSCFRTLGVIPVLDFCPQDVIWCHWQRDFHPLIWCCAKTQELCESGGGRPVLPVPYGPYCICGRKARLNFNCWLDSSFVWILTTKKLRKSTDFEQLQKCHIIGNGRVEPARATYYHVRCPSHKPGPCHNNHFATAINPHDYPTGTKTHTVRTGLHPRQQVLICPNHKPGPCHNRQSSFPTPINPHD